MIEEANLLWILNGARPLENQEYLVTYEDTDTKRSFPYYIVNSDKQYNTKLTYYIIIIDSTQ
jgi:hypothetical protein